MEHPTLSTLASATADVSELENSTSESEEEEVEIQTSFNMPRPARNIPAYSYNNYPREPRPSGFTYSRQKGFTSSNSENVPQVPSSSSPRAHTTLEASPAR
jgi:hypothetical protein